jgi:tRNA 2-thiocytidine biosynthesis protein TtcA
MLSIQDPTDTARATRRAYRTMLRTIVTHRLIRDGDRILVAVSGGKDSYTLLDFLWRARTRAPVRFEIVGLHVDQGQPGYDGAALGQWLERLGAPFEIVTEDTYSIVMRTAEDDPGAAYCRVCSRLRRGILYTAAERLGCNVVALGHHRDDAIETLLLNQLFAGRLQAMPATYDTNDGRFRVIRPLIECAEADLAANAAAAGYPILPCNLCGSQPDLKRARVRTLLEDLEREIPDVRAVLLASLKNVRASHLLDPEVAAAWNAKAHEYEPRR